MKLVSLALSGGSLKGVWAHIGFLKRIEELINAGRIRVKRVIGTSAGSIAGGLWCSNYNTDQITEIMRNLKAKDFLGWGSFWWIKSLYYAIPGGVAFKGLIKGEAFEKFLEKLLGYKEFKSCRPSFAVIVSNISKCVGELFSEGYIYNALRASSSIPYTFFPKELHNEWYIDGGVVANNPSEYLINHDPDTTILSHSFYHKRVKPDNSIMKLKGWKFQKKLLERILELAYWSQQDSAHNLANFRKRIIIDICPEISASVSLLNPKPGPGLETLKQAYDFAKNQLSFKSV